ncbi:hypothetical protein QN239_32310 [Mycolicibacterium sp. Y3]
MGSIGDRGRGLRLGVAAGLTALLVPVAGLIVSMISSDPTLIAHAAATPKPGSPGGDHSKPGDNKNKKKPGDNKKSDKKGDAKKTSTTTRAGSSARGSSADSAARRSGSSFSEQTNANNRWSADGPDRSVNTRISSQAAPSQPAQAPSQVQEAPPTRGQQNTAQPATPPQDTTPAQTSPPAAQQQTPTIVIPAQGEYAPGEQSTTTVTPAAPNDPTGPATALVVGLAAAGAGAASRRNGSATRTTSSDPSQGVRGGFSVTHFGQTDGDQTLVTLTDPSSPTRYNFDASQVVPHGGSLQVNPDQTVSILDASGTATGDGFSAPWARDATGAAQPTQFTAQGSTLTQTITPRPDAVYPITADPDGVEGGAGPALSPVAVGPDTAGDTPPPPLPETPIGGWLDNVSDPNFATRLQGPLEGPERTVVGNISRGEGKTTVAYLNARGWHASERLINRYVNNPGGAGSLGDTYDLWGNDADSIATDPITNAYGVSNVFDVRELAKNAAVTELLSSGKSWVLQAYENPTAAPVARDSAGNVVSHGPLWTTVAGGSSDAVLSLGRYQAQVVTLAQTVGQSANGNAIINVQQRVFLYDLTDYSVGAGWSPQQVAIDSLAHLREIGWARSFNTHGVTSVFEETITSAIS